MFLLSAIVFDKIMKLLGSARRGALERGGLTPHSKGFAANYTALINPLDGGIYAPSTDACNH